MFTKQRQMDTEKREEADSMKMTVTKIRQDEREAAEREVRLLYIEELKKMDELKRENEYLKVFSLYCRI